MLAQQTSGEPLRSNVNPQQKAMRNKRRQLNRAFLDAIAKGQQEEVSHLLDAGADINSKDQEHGEGAIHLASKFGDKELIEFLINQGANVEDRDDQGRTALFITDVASEIFEYLLASGADINVVDHEGNTILMRSVSKSCSAAEVVKLLQLGINPDARNADNESALDIALLLGLVNVVEVLKSPTVG